MHAAKLVAIGALGVLVADWVRAQSFVQNISPNQQKLVGLLAGGGAAAVVNHYLMHKTHTEA